MAQTKRNLLTRNYSGKVGDQYVMKTRGDKSIIAALPKAGIFKPEFEADRLKRQRRFKLAALYASKTNENPALKTVYETGRQGNQTAFNVAFKDAIKGPEVTNLRTQKYSGEAGQPIVVEAIDNFRVAKVEFTLTASDGSMLETGEAVQDENG